MTDRGHGERTILTNLDQPASAPSLDVVSHMCHVFRLGSSLCMLFNKLIPSFVAPTSPLYSDLDMPSSITFEVPDIKSCPDGVRNWAKRPENMKPCQKHIALFCMTMTQRKDEGRWPHEVCAYQEVWGKSSGDETEVEGYDSGSLMKVFQTVEHILDNLPETAMSPSSPTPTNTMGGSIAQSFAAISPMTASASTARQSYEHPLSSRSSTTLVNPLSASVNGSSTDIEHSVGPASVEQLKSASDTALIDAAFKTVEELVNSERSYVQELEILERCSVEILKAELVSAETVFSIFSNLRQILDFQRKFLIKLETEYEPIEERGCTAWAEGRWGRPFVDMEKEFECYGPYCANYMDAIKVVGDFGVNLMVSGKLSAIANKIQLGQALPEGERPCLHPERELTAFMIKPIQRITKYGLLLDAIGHATAKRDYPHRAELQEGLLAVRRIAADINETTAFKAKQATVRELVERVDDWKGHDHEKFGDLHLDDQFTVSKADFPRDYHVFLFEKMMLCCKEITPDKKAGKGGKNSSVLRKDKTTSKGGLGSKPRLALKGRIFVSNINNAILVPAPADQPYAPPRVQIVWSVPAKNGDSEQDVEDSFIMTGRSEDQMKKWVDKVLELAAIAKKEQNDRNERARQISTMSDSTQRPYWSQSQFAPPTPGTDHNGFFSPQTPSNPYQYLPGDEGDDDDHRRGGSGQLNGLGMSNVPGVPFHAGGGSSRRAQSQQSMPPISHHAEHRARAMTEDHNGPSMQQWRSRGGAPPLPQAPTLPRITSGHSDSSWSGSQQNGRRTATGTRPGHEEDLDDSERTPSTAPPGAFNYYESSSTRGMSRVPSQGVTPTGPTGPPPPLRARSASSPNVYQQPQMSPVPPLPHTAGTSNGTSPSWPGQNGGGAPYVSGSTSSSSTGLGSTPGGAADFNRRQSTEKRGSQESQTTETSETSSQSPRTPYTTATPGDLRGATPVSRQNSQEAAPSASPATVLVKVRSGDANFVIGIPSDISYRTLHEKVLKKLRICSARHAASIDIAVKIKWLDSDGDEVVINTDQDVQVMIAEADAEQIQLVAV
jgi:cell division control protein 24